jgi:2-(1,2-epoxy-1,2-dihydrophenyl)acetyl-CoA isomerase
MAYEFIKTENREGVYIITMHDPPTRNALGPGMASEILECLDIFEDDPGSRVLLLTGSEPSFCSGANVRVFSQRIEDREAGSVDAEVDALPWGKMESQFATRGQKVAFGGGASSIPLRIHQLQKPSIAAVNGHAMGVGMGVALACDIRYTAEKAVFSEAFARMGLIPGDGSCWQLPRLIGMSNTLLLQYTGDRIDGAEAYRLGIASKLFADDEVFDASLELASRLAKGATQSHALTKYLVHKSLSMDFEEALDLALVAQEQVRKSEDHKEAVQAFLEKRPANLKGR